MRSISRRRFLSITAGLVGMAACGPATQAPTTPGTASAPASPAFLVTPRPSTPSVAPSPSLGAAPAAATASPLPVAGSSPPELSAVNISYDAITSPSIFILIAAAQKIDQKYGVTFNTSFTAGSSGISALLSGGLQFQEGSGVSSIAAIGSGAALRILASFQNVNNYAIFARQTVNGVEDLKGKTVAVSERGANPDVSLRAALAPYGLAVDRDVSALAVGGDPSRFAAVVDGNVDAAVLDEAALGPRALAQGLHVVLSLTGEKLPWVGSATATTVGFLQQYPNTVFAVLKALIEGVRFLEDPNNRAACLPTIAGAMNVDPDDPQVTDFYSEWINATGIYDPTMGVSTITNALKDVNEAQYGNLTAAQVVDTTFLRQLAGSGFVTLDT